MEKKKLVSKSDSLSIWTLKIKRKLEALSYSFRKLTWTLICQRFGCGRSSSKTTAKWILRKFKSSTLDRNFPGSTRNLQGPNLNSWIWRLKITSFFWASITQVNLTCLYFVVLTSTTVMIKTRVLIILRDSSVFSLFTQHSTTDRYRRVVFLCPKSPMYKILFLAASTPLAPLYSHVTDTIQKMRTTRVLVSMLLRIWLILTERSYRFYAILKIWWRLRDKQLWDKLNLSLS